MKEYIEEVQKIIGIKFNEPKLLVTALTHSSYANQHREEEYNERFEFLGDSILQLTITEYLFLNFKDKSEGELTKIRSLIVCENSLYEIGINRLSIGCQSFDDSILKNIGRISNNIYTWIIFIHIKRGNIRGRSITNDAALSADKRTI